VGILDSQFGAGPTLQAEVRGRDSDSGQAQVPLFHPLGPIRLASLQPSQLQKTSHSVLVDEGAYTTADFSLSTLLVLSFFVLPALRLLVSTPSPFALAPFPLGFPDIDNPFTTTTSTATMSEEKVRSSNEGERPDVSAPILPTVNPAAVQAEPKKSGLPAWVYIA
jgi:hypothetical protein